MKNITHFVVTTNTDATLSFATQSSQVANQSPLPRRVLQWGSAGPWVLAWGTAVAPRDPVVREEPFLKLGKAVKHTKPIGSWFKRRRGP